MAKEITVVIDKDGNFTMDAKNIKGVSCLTTMEKILKETNSDIKSKKPTSEYYQRGTEKEKTRGM